MNLLPTIRWLIAPAILLPMLVAVLFGLMGLLSAIDDPAGEAVVRGIGIFVLAIWMVNIAALAIAVAVELTVRDEKSEE
ncbi:hypothetical protein NG895_26030 [Aeoliella sp. ICT_H6.2]|uniref:Uncharacterized protein n=1 Tax=Aeoliella straminimaris TaxID=2954799 RepID=A0A9X2FIP2_9BACT|nr:hypothetical protein [Aeoliella straminimaris]MCO6047376.1 hypothetical protein [Aeoliella straminimaris]